MNESEKAAVALAAVATAGSSPAAVPTTSASTVHGTSAGAEMAAESAVMLAETNVNEVTIQSSNHAEDLMQDDSSKVRIFTSSTIRWSNIFWKSHEYSVFCVLKPLNIYIFAEKSCFAGSYWPHPT